MNLSIGSSGSAQAQFSPSQMMAQLQNGITQLQSSDPTLAAKLTKVQTDLQQAQSATSSPKAAFAQAKQDLGTLSPSDMQALKDAFGSSTTGSSGSTPVAGGSNQALSFLTHLSGSGTQGAHRGHHGHKPDGDGNAASQSGASATTTTSNSSASTSTTQALLDAYTSNLSKESQASTNGAGSSLLA